MAQVDYIASYQRVLADLIRTHGEERAMDVIVGGQSEAIGMLEFSVLRTLGLQPEHTVVDVGSGSGRLAVKLAPFLAGKYYGSDILPEFAPYARKVTARNDWEFHTTAGRGIPAPDRCADFVCFFSVFTHLLPQDIYRYLLEAKRVLRPHGRIVFTFLDWALPSHWPVFEQTVEASAANPDMPLNQFIGKDAVHAWTKHLELKIERLHDGSEPWITLVKNFRYADGREAAGVVEFGQSVAVLSAR